MSKTRPNRNIVVEPSSPDYKHLDEMPLATVEDYRNYNKIARRQKSPVKIPPVHLHKHRRIKFTRNDGQQENVLKAYISNADIEYKAQLKSGHIYDLPVPFIKFLSTRVVPTFSEIKNPDGTSETKQTGEWNRFSCQTVDEDEDE